MNSESIEILRQKVKRLATQSQAEGDPTAWFDVLYSQANGDPTQIPWAKMTPHPWLQTWLDGVNLSEEGRAALVIGCGLGDDAEALAAKGFQVTGFDISPTAIAWCSQRFPHSIVNYLIADLLALDSSWKHKFDLVFECRTIQALPLELRAEIIEIITDLVAVKGRLLVMTRIRETEEPTEGPPWALSESELNQFQALGLSEVNRILFVDPNNQSIPQLGIEYIANFQSTINPLTTPRASN